MCRASGACDLHTPGTQRSRAGLATDAPPALASALAVSARDILTLPSHAQTRGIFSRVLIDQELRESGWDLLDEHPTTGAIADSDRGEPARCV
jgi:hypothetical protein